MKRLFFALILVIKTSGLYAQNNLDYYINAAKQNSPLIKENQNLSRANQLEIERLKAQFTKPQMGITGNYLFAPILSTDNNKTHIELNPKDATNYYGYDLGLTNGGQYQALLAINQPLFYQQRYKAYEEQANISNRIYENNIRLAEHDVVKLVTDQYILCLLDLQQINYPQEMMKLLQEQLVIVQKLANSALVKQSDVSLLNIEYKNFENQLALQTANYRRDLMDLKILAGISDTSFVVLDTLVLPISNASFSFTSQYLEKYRLDSLNLTAAQKVFETKYKPQINAFANSGLNTANISTIPRRFGMSAGLSVSWNFYDGRQKSITRRKTDILMQTVAAYKENFLAQNDLRKRKFLEELNSYKERAVLLEQQLDEYRHVVSSYKKELLSGEQSVINLINTIRNMALVQHDFSLLQTNRLLLNNAYNYWNW